MENNIKEIDIQLALHRDFLSNCDICIPNYTPKGWWECDFIHITKSGYMVEHEIKVSRADFFADAKKQKQLGFANKVVGKHQLLELGSEDGPRQFWFVILEGLIDVSEVPNFAGLKIVKLVENGGNPCVDVKVIKKAPFLHKSKADKSLKEHVLSVCYYRYWNEKVAHEKTRKVANKNAD